MYNRRYYTETAILRIICMWGLDWILFESLPNQTQSKGFIPCQ
jgi:hypothetical protein